MSRKLVIIGAGGHGKVIADMALKNGYQDISFIDDNATGKCMGFPIIGNSQLLEKLDKLKNDFIIAIGNNHIRKRIADSHEVNWIKLIHPSAQIAYGVEIAEGTVVMSGAVINSDTIIGRHCIINSCAVIEHDNNLGNYVHISPNAALGGTVTIHDLTHVGIGSTVKNNVTIGSEITVGAGAVVVKDLLECGTYVGVPARRSNK